MIDIGHRIFDKYKPLFSDECSNNFEICIRQFFFNSNTTYYLTGKNESVEPTDNDNDDAGITSKKCPEEEWKSMEMVTSLLNLPSMMWKWTEKLFFPYHWFNASGYCSIRSS